MKVNLPVEHCSTNEMLCHGSNACLAYAVSLLLETTLSELSRSIASLDTCCRVRTIDTFAFNIDYNNDCKRPTVIDMRRRVRKQRQAQADQVQLLHLEVVFARRALFLHGHKFMAEALSSETTCYMSCDMKIYLHG